MTAFRFGNADQMSSEFEARATLLSLQVSRALWRRRFTTPTAGLNNALELISKSQLVSGAAIWSDGEGERSEDIGFGVVEDAGKYTVGAHRTSKIWVGVGLIPHETTADASLLLLAELLAQQIGRFLTVLRLQRENETARQQLMLDRESLQLRRLMERAQTLLVRQGPMTRTEAGDYLAATSVRTGRPLVDVAKSVVLAYGGVMQIVNIRRHQDQTPTRRAVA